MKGRYGALRHFRSSVGPSVYVRNTTTSRHTRLQRIKAHARPGRTLVFFEGKLRLHPNQAAVIPLSYLDTHRRELLHLQEMGAVSFATQNRTPFELPAQGDVVLPRDPGIPLKLSRIKEADGLRDVYPAPPGTGHFAYPKGWSLRHPLETEDPGPLVISSGALPELSPEEEQAAGQDVLPPLPESPFTPMEGPPPPIPDDYLPSPDDEDDE
jgi:hypothetical protein